MCKLSKTLAALVISAITIPTFAASRPQTVQGAFCVPLAPGVPTITVERVNGTGQSIHDFTIWIVGASGALIGGVEVTSNQNQGADDWDVDDDGDGNQAPGQEPGERDDVDSSPGTSTRVDCKGDGKNNDGARENPPQNDNGNPIKNGSNFKIKVTFTPPPTAGASICFAPTDKSAGQIDSGQISQYCLYNGVNDYGYDSGHPFPGVTSALINQTGGAVMALEFQTTGDYYLMALEHVDEDGQTIMWTDCGGAINCFLPLAYPVMPGGNVCFSAAFDHYSIDPLTVLQVMPIVDFVVPVGGCCLPDGNCMENTFIDECALRGGFYLGDGAPCDAAYCEPTPIGACVFDETGECYDEFNEWDCLAADGVYLGPGSICPSILGDVDGDGDVDLSDLAALLGSYGACEGDPAFNPAADFDFDGCITLSDLAALLSNYGA